MILQWVKLHDQYVIDEPIEYGCTISYNYGKECVFRGNKLTWKRKNLWKCIEFVNNKIVEHIVYLESPHEKMLVLISKFMDSKEALAYTQYYKSGIKKLYQKYNSRLVCDLPLPQLFLNLVTGYTKDDGNIPVYNNIDEWVRSNEFIADVVPFKGDIYTGVHTSRCPLMSTQDDRSDDLLIKVDASYNILADTVSDIHHNLVESSEMFSMMDGLFTSYRYYNYGSLINRNSFQTSDITPAYVESRNTHYTYLETLTAPKITDIKSVPDKTSISSTEITKEIMALVTEVQLLVATDFRMIFDINKFSIGEYGAISVTVVNRYSKENFQHFLYVPTDDSLVEYEYKDLTSCIGEALCDYVLSLNNSMDVHNRTDLISLTKTYNEELVIQFGDYKKQWFSTNYVDIIGCILSSCDMGSVL